MHISQGQNISARLTDQEAKELAHKLLSTVAKREQLMAVNPAMADWADHSCTLSAKLGGEDILVSFAICAK